MPEPTSNSEVPNPRGALEPPRFSLRRLFYIVGAVAVCIALFQRFNPVMVGGGLFVLALVGLHVLGNAMGTRLRGSPRPIADGPPQTSKLTNVEAHEVVVPATKLSHRASLGWPLFFVTGVGMVFGGIAGAKGMDYLYGDRLETAAIVIGVVAMSALSGFWFFWCWSLAHVFLTAWWHAHSSATLDQQRKRRNID